MAVANVVARFTADTGDFHRKMGEAQKSFGSVADAATMSSRAVREFGEGMANAGKKLTVGVTLPLGGAGAAAVAAAMSFETAMSRIVGLVGIAADEVSNMGDEVLNMASGVGKSPDELAAGLFVITSAGLRGAEAMQTLRAAAMAGAAGLGETNDIARAVSGALSAYGSEVLSASEATDAIVATARAGNFETSQFAAAIGRVLPFAQQAGASFQDMGGAVALLTRVNGNAAESITQMQALFRAFVVPTEEAKKALDEVGLSAGDLRASIAEKGLPATLQMLDKALGGNREQLGRLLGSSEAASAAFQILNADANTINDTFGVVQDSAGMTIDAFGAVAETTQFQLSQAMNELKAGMIEVGESLLPVVQAIIDFADRWIKAFNSLPGPVKNIIVGMAALAAAIGPVLFIAGKLIVVFSTLLSFMLKMKAFQALRTAFAKLRTEMTLTRTSVAQTRTSFGLLGTSAKYAQLTVISSFKAIGTAAKGLVASFGPIGLALVGVTVILDTFMGRAAAMNDIIESLRDEVDLTEQALTRAGEKLAAQKIFELISPEDRAALEAYGISMAEVLEAVINGGPAMEELQDKLAGFRDLEVNPFGRMGADSIRQDIELVREGVVGSIESANSLAEANANAALRTSDAARSMKGAYREAAAAKREADRNMTDSQRAVDAALEAGIEAVEALEAAFINMQDALSDEASVDKAYRSINRLNEQLKEGDKSIKGYSDAALDNRQAIRDAAQAWIDYAAATDDPEEAQKRLAEGQKEIREALKANDLDPNDSKIFEMFKNQRKQSKETVDEFAKQRDKASEYGHDVGTNFIDGIVAELNRRREEVEAAAASVGSAMNTGAANATQSQSPSRTAMKIGNDFTDGLVIGLRSGGRSAETEAGKVALRLARQFERLMQPQSFGGAATNAFQMMFGTREDIKNSSRALQDATWALADARDAVFEAEKRLAEARKEGNAREIAAAERDLARARRDAADAADAKKTAEFTAENQKALLALERITQKYDYITAAISNVQGSLQGLVDLTATPFGLPSQISEMFGAGMNVNQLAGNFSQLTQMITDSYAVLVDPKIVGRKQARRNQRELNRNIRQIEEYVAQIIGLRQQLDAGLAREGELRKELADITKTFDEANRELDRITRERDGFVSKISSGFRSFVNNLSGVGRNVSREVIRQTKTLANGTQVIVERTASVSSLAASDIAESMRGKLNEVRQFSANISSLMARGLDPSLIRDFIESGVSGSGAAVAALASASDQELQDINATQAELLSHAEKFATESGEQFYGPLIAGQQSVVDGLQDQVDAAQAALDTITAENQALADEITEIGESITAMVEEMAATLPARTLQAGQDAVDKMIAGFREKFPDMKRTFGRLMNQLARSMSRTATITIRTLYAGAPAGVAFGGKRAMGGPVLADRAYLVGERGPELFLPGMGGNILPNSLISNVPDMGAGRGQAGTVTNITVNVSAGMGTDGDAVGRQIVEQIKRFERTNGPVFASA